MFPLGSVLLPGGVLPLHIFEERYRQLVRACLADDGEFGVVLIERGSEVGGGDVRRDVGTMAGIVEAAELPDGRWAVVAVGLRRIRVRTWLPDDPFPVADVEDWPEPDPGRPTAPAWSEVEARLRRVLARSAEMGMQVPPATAELAADPITAAYQASSLAPVGPADRYALLAAPDLDARVALLDALLADLEGDLARRWELGGDG